MHKTLLKQLDACLTAMTSREEKIRVINEFRRVLHDLSPFNHEPVDGIQWVSGKDIISNDYNPNVMAPAEKRLLQHSLETDGFTQPLVVTPVDGGYQIVDGFHRYTTGKASPLSEQRRAGYFPVTLINIASQGYAERVASTVRHNRARGKHKVTAMSDIVRDLVRQGWDNNRIARELGMDADEVLRLKQIGGLAELFEDETFSESWTVK